MAPLAPGLVPERLTWPPLLFAGTDNSGGVARPKGYFAQWVLDHGVTAVSGGCFALRSDMFHRVGGFDPRIRRPALRELDLSLSVGRGAATVLWSAHAQFRQDAAIVESDRDDASDLTYLRAKWGALLVNDPDGNPNLLATETGPCLAFPPRIPYPWRTAAHRTAA